MSQRSAKILAILAAIALAAYFTGKAACGDSGSDTASTVEDSAERAPSARLQWSHPDPAALPVATLSGTVTAEDGAPVAGASVCAWASSPDLSAEDTREPSCTRTVEDGTYTLARLLPASYRVTATAAGFLPAAHETDDERRTVTAEAGETLSGIDIVLARGGVEVTGFVKDIGGGPVSGALVTLRPRGSWELTAAHTRADASGRFSAWVVPGDLLVSAIASGYAVGQTQGIAPGQTITVYLTPESVLAGRVVDAKTGAPIPRARVSAGNLNRGQSWMPGAFAQAANATAYTDDDGHFRITRLSPGRYKPTAEGIGRYGQAAKSVRLGLGETRSDVVIEVYPAFVVSGRVLVAKDEPEPCADAMVMLSDKAAGRSFGGKTNEAGEVEIRAVLPGTYRVTIRCADYLERDEYPELAVVDKDLADNVWEVTAGATIRGRIHNGDGEPVAEVRVWTRTITENPRAQRTAGFDTTGKDGTFELGGLVAGTYKMHTQADAYPSTFDGPEVTVDDGGVAEIDIELSAGGSISGLVVDDGGAPVGSVSVIARGDSWSWSGNTRTQTRDDGTFTIEGIAPGKYRVIATRGWFSQLRSPGTTDDDLQGESVSVEAGEIAEVKLVVEDQSAEIRGRVLDESGQPVTDAFVTTSRETDSARGSGWSTRAVRWQFSRQPILTDLDGNFTVTGLSPGNYTVRAYRRGGGEALARHVKTGGEVTLTIPAASSISGKVVIAGGAAPDQFDIQILDEKTGYSRSEGFFRTAGTFSMTDLPAGTYQVSVKAKEGTTTDTVTVAAGESKAGIVLTLETRVTITGRAVDLASGKPVKGMRIIVQPAESMMRGFRFTPGEKQHITDAEGRFEIENAPAGRVFIAAVPTNWQTSDYSFARVLKTVPGGGTADVGDVPVPKRRVDSMRERGGDLGYELKQPVPGTDPEDVVLEVALIRPEGPAAESGLKVGDHIITVDGHDVSGANAALYYTLARVKPGTTVKLGVERGAVIEITAAEPI